MSTAPPKGTGGAQLAAAYGHAWLGWSADGANGPMALGYTRASAKNGEPQGQLQLGERLMLRPDASRATLVEALGWLSASAAQGCARAAWRAAQTMVLLGAGESTEPVLHAYQEAARLGSAEAAFAVSTRLVTTGREDTARGWLRAAAQGGLASAQEHLGAELLMEGNTAEGVAWAQRAAHQGDGPAQALVGQLVSTGNGVAHDQGRAYFWLLLATANEQSEWATQEAREKTSLWLQWARRWLTPEQARAVETETARWTPKAEKPGVPCVRKRTAKVEDKYRNR